MTSEDSRADANHLREIINSLEDGLMVIDHNHRIIKDALEKVQE